MHVNTAASAPDLDDPRLYLNRELDLLSFQERVLEEAKDPRTPLAFDPGRPFPHISNLSLNLAVLIRDAAGEEHFARVKVPDSLPALVPLTRPRKSLAKRNRTRSRESYVWIEEVIAANLAALF